MIEEPRKIKLTAPALVEHMKSKGITFELCDEKTAEDYLRTKNNYFRASSFRKLFPKHEGGEKDGLYIDLDFGSIMQLSYVDQSLRSLLRTMSLDVEHYEKVAILNRIESMPEEDAYSIVSDYKASLNEKSLEYLEKDIGYRTNDVYCGALISKYKDNMPVWVFFEIISFGTFIDFCLFCSARWEDEQLRKDHYMLKKAKSIRNAASHGSCIINGFGEVDNRDNKMPEQARCAIGMLHIAKTRMKRWLKNPRIREIATLIYLFSRLVPEGESKDKAKKEIDSFYREAEIKLSTLPSNNPAKAGIDFMKTLTKGFALG